MFWRFLLVVISVPLLAFGALTIFDAVQIGALASDEVAESYKFGSVAAIDAYGWSHASQMNYLLSGLLDAALFLLPGFFFARWGLRKRAQTAQ